MRQRSLAYGHRGLNEQPLGRLMRLGGWPLMGQQLALLGHVVARQRVHEPPGVGVHRRVEDLVDGAVLDRTGRRT